MNSRDRVVATFEGEPIDRVARVEYYWNQTIRRWSLQGLGECRVDFTLDGETLKIPRDRSNLILPLRPLDSFRHDPGLVPVPDEPRRRAWTTGGARRRRMTWKVPDPA